MLRSLLFLFAAVLLVAPLAAHAEDGARLNVVGESFELSANGRVLKAPDLVGAEFEIEDGGQLTTIRIDGIITDPARPTLELLEISLRDGDTGAWRPFCDADAKGRRAGFPVAGRWNSEGRYVKDADQFFLTCTSGAQGKCVIFGYDPWSQGEHGEDLAPYYEACVHMVRGDYTGRGVPFTRNGTLIDMWDDAGVQASDSTMDPAFRFEAGWAPTGAVCVARTRYENLLPTRVLVESRPDLGGQCDEAEARRRGALIFNRSK